MAVAAVMSAAVMMASAVLGLAAAPGAQAAGSGASSGAVHRNLAEVVVRPGQTLWAIAVRADPSADPRVVVRQIVELNALPSGTFVQPGDRLWVPRG